MEGRDRDTGLCFARQMDAGVLLGFEVIELFSQGDAIVSHPYSSRVMAVLSLR